MTSIVVFDFDGTLADSNDIKRKTFYSVSRDLRGSSKVLDDIFSASSPDRYTVFRKLSARLGLTEQEKSQLVKLYSVQTKKNIVARGLKPEALKALYFLKDAEVPCFINTATPTINIKSILCSMNVDQYFKSILGSPESKIDNLRHIIAGLNCSPSSLIVVGDGIDDRDSATAVGCEFLPVYDEVFKHLISRISANVKW